MALLANAVLPGTSVRSGTIDYRLQRKRMIDDVQAGLVLLDDVCDAHPALLRVANNAAEQTGEMCPICETGKLCIVGYAFGPRLGASGKCILNGAELQRIAMSRGVFDIYEIEVCPDCGWNCRLRSYQVGTTSAASQARS